MLVLADPMAALRGLADIVIAAKHVAEATKLPPAASIGTRRQAQSHLQTWRGNVQISA